MRRSSSVGTSVLLSVTAAVSGGPHNFALDFDGGNDYVQVPYSESLNPSASVTLEAWVQVDNTIDATQRGIAGLWNDQNSINERVFVLWHFNSKLAFAISHDGTGSTFAQVQSPSAMTAGWHHVAGVFDGTALVLYVDGTPVATTNSPGSLPSITVPFRIGRTDTGGNGVDYFDGKLDEVRLWDVGRTQQQIASNMNRQFACCSEPDLLASWSFSEGAGSIAFNAVGADHNGLLGNGTAQQKPSWVGSTAPVSGGECCIAGSLTVVANPDVVAGRAAFLAGGVPVVEFDWHAIAKSEGASYQSGNWAPQLNFYTLSVTLPDSSVNTISDVGQYPAAGALAIANWMDGGVYDTSSGAPAADLGLNDIESFRIQFGHPHKSVGFAVVSGAGNHPVNQDFNGATFRFRAFDEDQNMLGERSFSLRAGQVDEAWLTITSPVAFSQFWVDEIGAPTIVNQYFSNILTADELVEPNPIPTVSEWGFVVMTLLTLVAGTIILIRPRLARVLS